jgi:predicted pyridoxine 5'-phosphate oxidase superfamily flavin-nucleotide-binding protein
LAYSKLLLPEAHLESKLFWNIVMNKNFTQFAFTDSVKKVQERYGSRKAYARMETSGDQYRLTEREAEFIQSRDSFYMATVGESGWPYVQFRGGPSGFLKIVDDTTLGYADFRGNRQYISTGNLEVENRVALILMDYANQRRLKIWAEVTITEANDDPELLELLKMPDYQARIERAVLLRIQAFDWNCPQHITPRYTIDEIEQMRDAT